MTLITLISLTFFFGIVVTSAWSVNNPAHIEEYIYHVASKEGVPVKEALTIAKCESGLNKNAHNTKGENSVGVFQINLKYHPLTLEEAKNPFLNINYALDLYNTTAKDGIQNKWRPWRNCALKYGLLTSDLAYR